MLSCSSDIENQRVASEGVVESSMLPRSSAATVEAVEADVETSRVILDVHISLENIR